MAENAVPAPVRRPFAAGSDTEAERAQIVEHLSIQRALRLPHRQGWRRCELAIRLCGRRGGEHRQEKEKGRPGQVAWPREGTTRPRRHTGERTPLNAD